MATARARLSSLTSRRAYRAAVALTIAAGYALLAACFWKWRILAGARTSGPIDGVTGDLYTQYIPIMTAAFSDLGRGALPLWNPNQLAGVPTLPSWHTFGIFYPMNGLHWVLPVNVALGWTTCLHMAVAGIAMHWLARCLDLTPAAARFAAVAFLLSRPFLFEPNLFNAMALSPAVIAAMIGIFDAPSPRRSAAAAAILALQISSGGLQMVVYTLYSAAILLLITRSRGASHTWRALSWSAAALVLAVGLAAFVVAPTVAYSTLTYRRPGGLTLAQSAPLPTPTVLELVYALVDPTPRLPRLFVGWAALALVLLATVTRRRRLLLALLTLTLFGLLIVLGPHTPFYALYRQLPAGSWFRVPQRALLIPGIGIALLAALGVDELRRRGWHRTTAWLFVLPAIELFHATWSDATHPQTWSAAALAPPEQVSFIKDARRGGRIYIARNWSDRFPYIEKLGTWQEFPVAQDYEPLTAAVYRDFVTTLLGPKALIADSFTGRYHPLFDNSTARRALDLLGVTMIVVAPGASASFDGTKRASQRGPLLISNPTALPRAYLRHRVTAANPEEALDLLTRPDFDPATAAVIVAERGLELLAAPSDARETVEVLDTAPENVSATVHVERPAWLILRDVLLPGWEADVDGAPTSIHLANGLFRGVYLDSGEHVVRFRYRSLPFEVGVVVSVATALLLIAMVFARPFTLGRNSRRGR